MAGRPSLIDQAVAYRDDGTAITVADRIVAALRTGAYFENACASAGVHRETAYNWKRIAARLRISARGVDVEDLPMSEHERKCLAFSDAVEEAESTWELRSLSQLESAARGQTITQTTTKEERVERDDGTFEWVEVERVTVTREIPPNTQVVEWRLERKHPDRYGRRIEVVPAGGRLDPADHADALIDSLSAYLAGHEDAAVSESDTPTP
jgi:hypothetical protein